MQTFARAGAIIKKDGSYLFMKRVKKGLLKDHNFYAIIGGRPDEGETPKETVIREVLEESGLKITLKPNFFICDEGLKSGYYTAPEYFFWADSIEGTPKLGGEELEFNSPENSYELVWIPEKDLASIELLPPSVHAYIMKQL